MNRKSLIALVLLLTAGARAAEPEAPQGVLTKAPAVLEPVEPESPAEAKAQGLSAQVVLEVDISETGEVLAAQVTQPAGNGFDEAAVAAARKLRFSPAEIDGQPSPVRIEYRFNFELREEPPPPPEELPLDSPPVVAKSESPRRA